MAMVLDVVAFEEDGLILTEWRSEENALFYG
jgi:hypothetical protein